MHVAAAALKIRWELFLARSLARDFDVNATHTTFTIGLIRINLHILRADVSRNREKGEAAQRANRSPNNFEIIRARTNYIVRARVMTRDASSWCAGEKGGDNLRAHSVRV